MQQLKKQMGTWILPPQPDYCVWKLDYCVHKQESRAGHCEIFCTNVAKVHPVQRLWMGAG